jgi:HEXXH motif-containing protein
VPDARAIDPPRDLTIPDVGSKTTYAIFSRAIARLLAEVRPLLRARTGGAVGDDIGPLASVLRKPNLGALARALRTARGDERVRLETELVALTCFELATLGALARDVRLDELPPRLVSLAARRSVPIPSPSATFRNRAVTFHAPTGDVDLDRDLERFPALSPTLVLALADNNPFAMVEAHPDKSGNAVSLGGKSVDDWVSSLTGALALIAKHLPALRAELDLVLAQFVPVGFDAERHLSASYQEAIGTIYLSLHPSLMTMTEAVIHELSHNKLNALFESDDVLENAFSPLYASPVRPDPRPLHGVLLAVHAFLPVARLYETMLESNDPLAEGAAFEARFRDIVRINREGAEVVLKHARPTRIGHGVLDEIARWDAHYAGL